MCYSILRHWSCLVLNLNSKWQTLHSGCGRRPDGPRLNPERRRGRERVTRCGVQRCRKRYWLHLRKRHKEERPGGDEGARARIPGVIHQAPTCRSSHTQIHNPLCFLSSKQKPVYPETNLMTRPPSSGGSPVKRDDNTHTMPPTTSNRHAGLIP